jgi:hypothetical protein
MLGSLEFVLELAACRLHRRPLHGGTTERPFGVSATPRFKQYLPMPLRPASLILSDHCPILQRPRMALGENMQARVS